MYKKLIAILVTVCIICTAGSVLASEGQGGQGGAFLRIPIGARPAGMGNAFVSVSDDANALYFNPGGLYQIKGISLGAMWSFMSIKKGYLPRRLCIQAILLITFG